MRAAERGVCACAHSGVGISPGMNTLLWIVAVILVIAGVFGLVRGQVLWGIALIVAGLLIGPGGVSLLT